MGAVAAKSLADLRRRRLQSVVLAIVLFLGAGGATLALSILVETNEPFDHAFAAADGAHLIVDYGASATDAQLAATARASGVTASAGPWPVAGFALRGKGGIFGGQLASGRPTPSDTIDRVTMLAGRWWAAPGEIVLDQDTATLLDVGLGDSVPLLPDPAPDKRFGHTPPGGGGTAVLPAPGAGAGPVTPGTSVTATVVGIAASVSTPDVAGWLSPSDIMTLAGPDASLDRQMLYRVDPAATAADLTAAMAHITAGLPADAVDSSTTYLQTKADADSTAQLYVPILLAFSIFALLAAAFTIANVVGGIVLTSYRDIGVMKAVGFTPGQVTAILLTQILVPVAIGTALGVVAGIVASQPLVARTAQSFGLPGAVAVSPTVIVAVMLVSIGVCLLAAIGPAIDAGRLSAIGAISRGTAPSRRSDGGRLRRLGLRLPISVPARLGVAAGVAHPVRAAMTLGALVVGVAAVTFAVGMNLSLLRVEDQLDRTAASPVRVELNDPSADQRTIAATIAAAPGTGRSVGLAGTTADVRGLGPVPFVGYDGDASWIGYDLIAGRWFAGQGEVVAPTAVFTQTGLHLGDSLELSSGGRTVTVTLVGEIFDTADRETDHLVLRGAFADLTILDPGAGPTSWEVQPTSGTNPLTYADALEQATDRAVSAHALDAEGIDEGFVLFLSVITFMGIVLVAISLGGVFDTVLLETKQRTREMAVLKALGMSPRQVIVMVVASVLPVALVAGLIGVPLGLVFQHATIGYMGQVDAGTRIPERTFDVFAPAVVVGLALSGLAIAAAGAYLPALRAARARIAPVLQAE
ncbi:MAG TPA: ABC transporter permease [Candidatus Limnocylindrales bacterium]|nr:ABC transporter permease [Candidatus Limnocylindrales bacterium]